MSEPIERQSVDAVARRLEQVRGQMASTTQRLQARVNRFGIIAIVLAIVLAIYFSFAYSQLTKFNAHVAVAAATDTLKTSYLGDMKDKLGASLKEKAPDVIRAGGDKLLQAPATMKAMLTDFILGHIDKRLNDTRQEFYLTVRGELGPLAQKIKDSKPNATDDQRLNLLIDELANDYERSAQRQIDDMYKTYATQSTEMSAYLKRLSSAKDLSHTEALHKKIIQTFAALLDKLDDETPTTKPAMAAK